MGEQGWVPLSECVVGGVYWVRVRHGNTLAVFNPEEKFVHVVRSPYGRSLLAERHVEAAEGGSACHPVSFYGMLPAGIPLETNLGLVCDKCGCAVKGSPWVHTNASFPQHKPSATWKKNTELIDYLTQHET